MEWMNMNVDSSELLSSVYLIGYTPHKYAEKEEW